jgi:hypothetical protein
MAAMVVMLVRMIVLGVSAMMVCSVGVPRRRVRVLGVGVSVLGVRMRVFAMHMRVLGVCMGVRMSVLGVGMSVRVPGVDVRRLGLDAGGIAHTLGLQGLLDRIDHREVR